MQHLRVSVILPAKDEAESIGVLLSRIKDVPGADEWEIIVVDDGSVDATAEVAEQHGARVVQHPENQGNGASVRSGGTAATGDILVFMDADGQHPPEDIPKLLEHIGSYDMVVGERCADSDVSRFRSIGNWVLNGVAQYTSQHPIPDLTSGFRVVKKGCFERFKHLFPQRYSYPTTITLSMLLDGFFVKYVPLPGIGRRQGGTSNIKPFRDGARFLKIILRIVILFNPMRFFMPISLMTLAVGSTWVVIDCLVEGRVLLEQGPLLVILFSAGLFFFGILADQISHVRREIGLLRQRESEK